MYRATLTLLFLQIIVPQLLCIPGALASSLRTPPEPPGVFETPDQFSQSWAHIEYARAVEQCGISAAYAIARRFGKQVHVDAIIQRCPNQVLETGGMTVSEFAELLGAYSLHCAVVTGEFDKIVSRPLNRGCVVVVPNVSAKHFFVYFDLHKSSILRFNPPHSVRWVPQAKLKHGEFKGTAIIVSPNPLPHDQRQSPVAVAPPMMYVALIAGIGSLSAFLIIIARCGKTAKKTQQRLTCCSFCLNHRCHCFGDHYRENLDFHYALADCHA